jgi:hypothetical protein
MSASAKERDLSRSKAVQHAISGDHQSAAQHAIDAYRTGQILFGSESEELLPECFLLSKAHRTLGQTDDAKLYVDMAANIVEREPYSDPTANVALFRAIADEYCIQRDWLRAEKAYIEYCGRTERLYGDEHLATSECYNKMAHFHMQRGQMAIALEFCYQAKQIVKALLDEEGDDANESSLLSDHCLNLGLLYRLNGDLKQSLDELFTAHRIRQQLFGMRSMEVSEIEISLGFTEYQLGNILGALEHYEKAYVTRYLLTGPTAKPTKEAMDLLNGVLAALHRPSATNYQPPEIAGAKTQLFSPEALSSAMVDLVEAEVPASARMQILAVADAGMSGGKAMGLSGTELEMRLPESHHASLRIVLVCTLETIWSGIANNPSKATTKQQKRAKARAKNISRKSGGLGPLGRCSSMCMQYYSTSFGVILLAVIYMAPANSDISHVSVGAPGVFDDDDDDDGDDDDDSEDDLPESRVRSQSQMAIKLTASAADPPPTAPPGGSSSGAAPPGGPPGHAPPDSGGDAGAGSKHDVTITVDSSGRRIKTETAVGLLDGEELWGLFRKKLSVVGFFPAVLHRARHQRQEIPQLLDGPRWERMATHGSKLGKSTPTSLPFAQLAGGDSSSSASSSSAASAQIKFRKYRLMQVAGVTNALVREQMLRDGVASAAANIVAGPERQLTSDADTGGMGPSVGGMGPSEDETEVFAPMAASASEQLTPSEVRAELVRRRGLQKFDDMLRAGMPAVATREKMRMERKGKWRRDAAGDGNSSAAVSAAATAAAVVTEERVLFRFVKDPALREPGLSNDKSRAAGDASSSNFLIPWAELLEGKRKEWEGAGLQPFGSGGADEGGDRAGGDWGDGEGEASEQGSGAMWAQWMKGRSEVRRRESMAWEGDDDGSGLRAIIASLDLAPALDAGNDGSVGGGGGVRVHFGDLSSAQGAAYTRSTADDGSLIVLDPGRAHNIRLMLHSLSKTPAELQQLVLHMDHTAFFTPGPASAVGEGGSTDDAAAGGKALSLLRTLIPRREEIEAVTVALRVAEDENDGGSEVQEGGVVAAALASLSSGGGQTLGSQQEAAAYVLQMSNVPRAGARVRGMQLLCTFDASIKGYAADLQLLTRACGEIKVSDPLRQIMRLVLALGERLEGGKNRSRREEGGQFRISNLARVTNMRTNQGLTLLQYLVAHLAQHLPHLLSLDGDFANLEAAVNARQSQLVSDGIQALQGEVSDIEKQIYTSGPKEEGQIYRVKMTPFVHRAKPVLSSLAREHSAFQADFRSLCRYLGEDPRRIEVEDLLGALRSFLVQFVACRDLFKSMGGGW